MAVRQGEVLDPQAIQLLLPFRGSVDAVEHQGGGLALVPELGRAGQIQALAEHNPQRFRAALPAAGEQGIVSAEGSAADEDRVALGPQPMHPGAGRWTGDPLTGAVG